MKKVFRKNQIIITGLALMIAAAGYLNYSGKLFQKADTDGAETASQELLDISDEELAQADGDASGEIASQDSDDETPGTAVLTSGEISSIASEAKVSREQVRAENKETLQGIIDNESLSESAREDASAQLLAMTERAEQEAAAESLLASKGFTNSVVNLSENSADVLVGKSELTDSELAQIEDIITRKTDASPENIVISPISSASTQSSSENSDSSGNSSGNSDSSDDSSDGNSGS